MAERILQLESKDAGNDRVQTKSHHRHPENTVKSSNINSLILQRKADCACGGGCPTCQEKHANLSVSHPHDASEIEADQMADKVMRMKTPEPADVSSTKNSVQRKESGGDSISGAPPLVRDVINSSGGRSLDDGTRSFMESRFNYDFSRVKIHDNAPAAKSAGSINALAYTLGNNIVFNSGQYNPNSDSGKRLLAHELTHVVQQNSGAPNFLNNNSTLKTNHAQSPDKFQSNHLSVMQTPISIQRAACNFYVYDNTEPTNVGRGWALAAVGLALKAHGGYAVASGNTIEEMLFRIISRYAEEDCDCIEEIQFLSHGSAGNAMYISKTGEELTASDYNIPELTKFGDGPRNTPEYNAWYAKLTLRQRRLVLLRRVICDSDAEIYYRSCEAFQGKTGQDFAKISADFWRSKVIGHTKVIAFTQPGKKVLKPGQQPDWSETEGTENPTRKKPIGFDEHQKPKKN
jgi:hypothetical protein